MLKTQLELNAIKSKLRETVKLYYSESTPLYEDLETLEMAYNLVLILEGSNDNLLTEKEREYLARELCEILENHHDWWD